MVEPVTEQTHRLAPVLLEWQRLVPSQPLAGDVCPAEGQRHYRQQLPQEFGVGDVRCFKAEAARLQAAEQRPDFPAPGVVLKQRLGLVGRADDNVFVARQPQAHDEEPLTEHAPRALQPEGLADAPLPEQATRLHALPAPVRHLGVGPHPDAEWDALALEVSEPVEPDELPVCAQETDGGAPEPAQVLFHERDPLPGLRAPLLRQDRPEQREGDAFVRNAEQQDVERSLAQAPVGAVDGDDPRRGLRGEPGDQARHLCKRQLEEAEEALCTLVVRRGLGSPGEDANDLGEVDGLRLDERDDEARQEVDTRLVPRYILRERPLQQADVGHCAIPFHVSFGDGR